MLVSLLMLLVTVVVGGMRIMIKVKFRVMSVMLIVGRCIKLGLFIILEIHVLVIVMFMRMLLAVEH